MSLLNSKINSIEAEVEDVALQVSTKQPTLTINGNDTTTYKLIDKTQVRDLIGARGVGISLSANGNDLTLTGPDLSGYQPVLTINGNDTTTYKLIDNTQVRDLKAGINASISRSGYDLTISGPDLSQYISTSTLTTYLTNPTYNLTLVEPILANFTLQGGGVVTWTGGYLTWTTRVTVIPIPTTSSISSQGHYDTLPPTTGTQITKYAVDGTAASSTQATASGIPLDNFEALFLILPIGNNPPPAGNYAIANFNNRGWTPNQNWILIAARNGDTGQLKWLPGQITLPNPTTVGQSVVTFDVASGYRSWCPDWLGNSNLLQGFALTGSVSTTQKYYHVCTLYLPQGGHQARITVNCLNDYRMNAAGTGGTPIINQQYNVYNSTTRITTNPVQNYVLEIHLYSSNGVKTGTTTYTGGSNACFAFSAPTGSVLATNGVFWGGFAMNNTPSSNSLGVFLAPSTADILNYLDVWMLGYANMGTPLATVVQTAGSASNLAQTTSGPYMPSTALPTTGFLKLPIYNATMAQYSY